MNKMKLPLPICLETQQPQLARNTNEDTYLI